MSKKQKTADTTASDYEISFEDPPVIEVVCGVQFPALEDMAVPHLGVLWTRYQPEFPFCKEQSPIAPMFEKFDGAAPTESKAFEIIENLPMPRVWFIRPDESGLIQVQKDRFLYNWKKVREEQDYPRYHSVIAEFEKHLDTFLGFLKENSIGEVKPNQYEMSYINQIPCTVDDRGIADLVSIFPDWNWRNDERRFLSKPDGMSLGMNFKMPEQSGRLHVTIQTARRISSNSPVLQLTLTARGIGKYDSLATMKQWFDEARKWIVHAFVDLTSHDAQQNLWRIKK